MARSSLIEFQDRLASRLQAAQQAESESRWLAVRAGGEHLLLPLAQSGEISTYEAPMALPHAKPWFVGLVNLRGQLCGVIDLAAFLGAGAAQPSTAQSRLVQFSARLELNAVLLVDQLAGLRTPSQFVVDAAAGAPAAPWLGPWLRDADGLRWRELNLAALAEDPRFLQVV
jgi:twitching motility protein PilI